MTNWKPIDSAPTDGRALLLWARLTSVPAEPDGFNQVVGFWDRSIGQWKIAPEILNKSEVLDARYWTELPNPPINEART
jgi:hypothetical protein